MSSGGGEDFLNCTRVSHATVECDGKEYHLEELLQATDGLFWGYLVIYMALVLFAGLRAGVGVSTACQLLSPQV